MKNQKKKPGDMAAARSRHLRRQAIQDAITAVKRGETVPVTMHGGLWEISPFPEEGWVFPAICLVRVSGSRLQIGWVSDKDGIKMCLPNGGVMHVGDKILALAQPIDEVAKSYYY